MGHPSDLSLNWAAALVSLVTGVLYPAELRCHPPGQDAIALSLKAPAQGTLGDAHVVSSGYMLFSRHLETSEPASQSCRDSRPQAGWFRTTEMDFLSVLEVKV